MTRISLTALLLAAAVSTAANADIKKGAKAAAEAAPDDVICTYEKTLGSNLKRRVCATRQARDEQRRADREAIGKLKSGSNRGSANAETGL